MAKATIRQQIVSEAIHRARTQDFEAGLRYLHIMAEGIWKNPPTLEWFADVCLKHGIPSPLYPGWK